MIVLNKNQIIERIDPTLAAEAIADAYRAASAGRVQLPPVGYLEFPDHGGDCHVKFGHRHGDDLFVIKTATGFPGNPSGVPVNNGVSLAISAVTGEVVAVLHDESHMTDVRTGIGGAIASRALAASGARKLLIVGTGVQATEQLAAHRTLLSDDLDVQIWGRSSDRARSLATAVGAEAVDDLEAACGWADIVVCVTAARLPLIDASWITPGTHITAVGADAPGKKELDADLLERADVLVADSVAQCVDHGEFAGLDPDRIVELGDVLSASAVGRVDDRQVTIADLTGIAAQDIAMVGVVLAASPNEGDAE